MRCAAAGNLLMLKTATSGSHLSHSHHRSPTSSSWHVVDTDSPLVDENRESGRWPGLLLTVQDAREYYVLTARTGNRERISNLPHPH
jgi:hypothetical protein